MEQFYSSWRFVFKNFKSLISLGLPWLLLTIISIGFISNKLPEIEIDQNVAADLAVYELMETLSEFYNNNVTQHFVIELMINVLFIVFLTFP